MSQPHVKTRRAREIRDVVERAGFEYLGCEVTNGTHVRVRFRGPHGEAQVIAANSTGDERNERRMLKTKTRQAYRNATGVDIRGTA